MAVRFSKGSSHKNALVFPGVGETLPLSHGANIAAAGDFTVSAAWWFANGSLGTGNAIRRYFWGWENPASTDKDQQACAVFWEESTQDIQICLRDSEGRTTNTSFPFLNDIGTPGDIDGNILTVSMSFRKSSWNTRLHCSYGATDLHGAVTEPTGWNNTILTPGALYIGANIDGASIGNHPRGDLLWFAVFGEELSDAEIEAMNVVDPAGWLIYRDKIRFLTPHVYDDECVANDGTKLVTASNLAWADEGTVAGSDDDLQSRDASNVEIVNDTGDDLVYASPAEDLGIGVDGSLVETAYNVPATADWAYPGPTDEQVGNAAPNTLLSRVLSEGVRPATGTMGVAIWSNSRAFRVIGDKLINPQDDTNGTYGVFGTNYHKAGQGYDQGLFNCVNDSDPAVSRAAGSCRPLNVSGNEFNGMWSIPSVNVLGGSNDATGVALPSGGNVRRVRGDDVTGGSGTPTPDAAFCRLFPGSDADPLTYSIFPGKVTRIGPTVDSFCDFIACLDGMVQRSEEITVGLMYLEYPGGPTGVTFQAVSYGDDGNFPDPADANLIGSAVTRSCDSRIATGFSYQARTDIVGWPSPTNQFFVIDGTGSDPENPDEVPIVGDMIVVNYQNAGIPMLGQISDILPSGPVSDTFGITLSKPICSVAPILFGNTGQDGRPYTIQNDNDVYFGPLRFKWVEITIPASTLASSEDFVGIRAFFDASAAGEGLPLYITHAAVWNSDRAGIVPIPLGNGGVGYAQQRNDMFPLSRPAGPGQTYTTDHEEPLYEFLKTMLGADSPWDENALVIVPAQQTGGGTTTAENLATIDEITANSRSKVPLNADEVCWIWEPAHGISGTDWDAQDHTAYGDHYFNNVPRDVACMLLFRELGHPRSQLANGYRFDPPHFTSLGARAFWEKAKEVADVIYDVASNPPVAVQDKATVEVGQTIVIDVLANDFDPDGDLDPTSVVITGNPSFGTVDSVNATTGEVTYTAPGSPGGDAFFYTVDDLAGNTSKPAPVVISITEPPGGGGPGGTANQRTRPRMGAAESRPARFGGVDSAL